MRIRRRGTALMYRLLSRFTERFPDGGAALVDRMIFLTYGNPLLHRAIHARDAWRLGSAYRRICVLADLHIGDALIGLGAASALRDFFPDARIDYTCHPVGAGLLAGDPDITAVLPVYSGTPFPDERDLQAVNAALARGGYDLVVDLCPFLAADRLAVAPGTTVIPYLGLAACIVEAQRDPGATSHMIAQSWRFVHRLFAPKRDPVRHQAFRGARIGVPAEAAERAARFLGEAGLGEGTPKILVNPDTSSAFTRVPEALLAQLIEGLAEAPADILLERGFATAGLGQRIVDALPAGMRRRVTLVPSSLPLDVVAALIDACDVFITGDGGPLHIAAARKRVVSGAWAPRNRTAVFSIFGATPARVYAYASDRAGFLPANQDAPSRAWVADSSCRTFAHINKGAIACADGRCFFGRLDVAAIVDATRAWLAQTAAGGGATLSAATAPAA